MPRTKSSPQKSVKTASNQPSVNTWVLLTKDTSADNDEDQSEIVRLGHPASDKPAMFLFGPGNRVVQEVLVFDEKKRSWFINDSVKSDGKLYLSTPIDPLFLVLPYLRKSQLAQPLEQCLWDEDFPDTSRLMQCKDLKLSLVADRKGEESLQAFKFNEDKSLKWLERKIEKVVNVLKRKGIHVSQNAVSATYVTSTKCDVATEAEYLKYAHGIVSEYLAEDLSKKLAQHLNIPDEAENKKRKLNSPRDEMNEKKQKKDSAIEESPKEKIVMKESSKPEKVQKSSASSKKELARQKAAAGSKSITSFFKKK